MCRGCRAGLRSASGKLIERMEVNVLGLDERQLALRIDAVCRLHRV